MGSVYTKADDDINQLVATVMDKWHPEFKKAKLQIGTLMAIASSESKSALTENGFPAEGIIKIVALRDRITKNFDVEIVLNYDDWKTSKPEHKVALIDHLLSRLELKKPRPKKKKKAKGNDAAIHGTDEERESHSEHEFITDDIGRPVLKRRKGDFSTGVGYRDVIERHGKFSLEARTVSNADVIVKNAIIAHENKDTADTE